MNGFNGKIKQVIDRPSSDGICIAPDINIEQLSNGGIAMVTIFAMIMFIKQVRLLVESSKES